MKTRMHVGLLFLALWMAMPVRAQGPGIDEYRDLAAQAHKSGDLQAEADYICKAASLDEKKYEKHCTHTRQIADQALAQLQADLAMAQTELQHKDFPGALRDLEKITFGPDKAAAQKLILQARNGINGLPLDEESRQALQIARASFAQGDFDAARKHAKEVDSPSLLPAVNQLLTSISTYQDNMKQAEVLEHNGDLSGAEHKYQSAAAIQGNGPGRPLERLQVIQAQEAQAQKAEAQKAGSVSAPTGRQMTQPPKTDSKAKIKELLVSARRAETKGDLKLALFQYNAALTLNVREEEAIAGKARVSMAMRTALKDDGHKLAAGIAAFYTSRFMEAADALRLYLQEGGKDFVGAAHFYVGASLLAQSMLSAPNAQSQAAAEQEEALQEFSIAKQLHYKPLQEAVSPKILARWTQIGGGQE